MAVKVNQLDSITKSQIDTSTDLVPVFDASANVLKKATVEDLPSAGVNSFNGRTGAVSPADNDYSIEQITATGTQGQVPILNPQGKLQMGTPTVTADADDVTVTHPTGTSIPVEVTNAQEGLETIFDARLQVMYSNSTLILIEGVVTNVQVTLTLRGAKSDQITIKNSNDVTVGSCNFASGQTQGTCQIIVPVGGGTYTFTSTVGSYSKTAALSDAATQTVNVYPDNYLLWHGNNIGNFELYTNSNYGTSSFTENATNLAVSFNGDGSASLITGQKIDLTDVNTITVVGTFTNFLNYCIGIMPTKASPARQYISGDFTTKTSYNAPTVLDVSSVTGEYYFCVVGEDNRNTNSHFEITSVELT